MQRLASLALLAAAALAALAQPTRAAGLLSPTDKTLPPLRITGHAVDISIRDQVALTEITQTFHNDTPQRLEATYVFPLPENADLTEFQMTFNGKLVKGEVLPAAEARRVYEDIVRRTRDPGLIEFIGRRLLQMRVFPIEPGSDTTIKVRYQQVTRPISGMNGYHYPLRTPGSNGHAYGQVRFTASLQTTAALKGIWSPSHAIEIVRESDHAARVAYEASGGSLDEDFLLLYDTADTDLGLSVVALQLDPAKPGHFVLVLTPKQLWPQAQRSAQDVVFVIDTSGSMAGEKIEQAKAALNFCIDQLGEGDRFCVVRFSTGFDVLMGGLNEATREKRAEAQRLVEGFSAAGGTNITDTLVQVASMVPAEGTRPFVVVFMTDGRGNGTADQTLAALKGRSSIGKPIRIFPFGVGHDVDTILLDRLANDYAGRPTYVQPGENLELVLGDFFAVVSKPVLTNLQLALPGIGVTERFPATLGDLYHGQQIIVAGRFSTAMRGPVTLTADRGGERVEFTWPDVAFTSTAEATYVPSVWAGRKIAFLLDEIRKGGESKEMIDEVVALSREYGIQTPYSSWLIVPEGDPRWQPVIARQREIIPQQMRRPPGPGGAGFGVSGGGGGRSMGKRSAPAPGAPPASFDGAYFDSATARRAVTESAGEAATIIAGRIAEMRDASNVDGGRMNHALLATRKLGDRTYNQIEGWLVDAAIDEKAQITILRFGSAAYFELVLARADLRPALAAAQSVVVLAAPGQALLVADGEGLEEFSAAQREQFGLPAVLKK